MGPVSSTPYVVLVREQGGRLGWLPMFNRERENMQPSVDTQELAESVAQLIDVEKIKQLKARYFRLMDERLWDEWSDVFAEHCEIEATIPDLPDKVKVVQGRAAIVEHLRWGLAGGTLRGKVTGSATVHRGCMPEIEIVGPGRATGIWSGSVHYLQPSNDPMAIPIGPVAYFWYGEEYEKGSDDRWRIAKLKITLRHAARFKDRPIVGPRLDENAV
jgi:hypothetical protein